MRHSDHGGRTGNAISPCFVHLRTPGEKKSSLVTHLSSKAPSLHLAYLMETMMGLAAEYLETYPKLQRLVEQVEARQLHVQTAGPRLSPSAWLARWLSTPFDDLDGRQPAYFLPYADYDLILIGLLIKLQTSLIWQDSMAGIEW